MAKFIPLSTPVFDGEEKENILNAINAGKLATSGEFIEGFEEAIQQRHQGIHAAVMNSGTSAIHLALKLLGVGKGDEVLCQSLTFCATANPIAYLGASPVFVDSETETWNICPETLSNAINDRISRGKKPKAIIAVDLFGMPAKYDVLNQISKTYTIPLIEDSAEAMGSSLKGKLCGTFGEFGIFSFNGNKIITTGGGGALLSSNQERIEKAKYLSVQARENYKYYVHKEVGFNYRMNNMSAAIGLAQIGKLDYKIERRRTVYQNYVDLLKNIDGITFLDEPNGFYSNRWLSAILIDKIKTGFSNEELRLALLDQNIESRYLWKPLHTQPSFKESLFYSNGVSEDLFDKGLCLPSSEDLIISDQERIVKVIIGLRNK
ncbi:aminotransferase class I/II-fold pyridoxal phosphate-dependent enzyme [Aquiflexum lacus]|uniref:aminotransferase class I/II-fold pyridoxal phosphate-dependent enzyme n=1 Tax=Aquiflexum lacus TaxID=2483805 RepID=UPI0018945A44|nr:aminotransferase class I/II-fold pyridoxal phosphate-dependent enzyme [Aquiflexum lacus]